MGNNEDANIMKSVAAIVPTFNRLELLKENINALLSQTVHCDIIIINNASNDGTKAYLDSLNNERLLIIHSATNTGGAGGFSIGVKKGEELGYDFLWLMDDDSIPEKDALESLMEKGKNIDYYFSFLASLVYWTDDQPFEMNIPGISYRNKMEAHVELIRKYKIMPINYASFVGCLINTKYSKRIGLPIKEFFIYGDDAEYTSRLVKTAPAYLDLDSIIVHKAPSNKGTDIALANADRIMRFYYQSRNGMYIARKNGLLSVAKRINKLLERSIRILKKSEDFKFKRLSVLYRGTLSGVFFNPQIEKPYAESISEKEET